MEYSRFRMYSESIRCVSTKAAATAKMCQYSGVSRYHHAATAATAAAIPTDRHREK